MRQRWDRWRRTPRRSAWHVGREGALVPTAVAMAWLVAFDGVRLLVTGAPLPPGRTATEAALGVLVALVVAVPGTYFLWAWLRRPRDRPAEDPPPHEVRELAAGAEAREDAERTAWRSRP